jgi:hypothetical protein
MRTVDSQELRRYQGFVREVLAGSAGPGKLSAVVLRPLKSRNKGPDELSVGFFAPGIDGVAVLIWRPVEQAIQETRDPQLRVLQAPVADFCKVTDRAGVENCLYAFDTVLTDLLEGKATDGQFLFAAARRGAVYELARAASAESRPSQPAAIALAAYLEECPFERLSATPVRAAPTIAMNAATQEVVQGVREVKPTSDIATAKLLVNFRMLALDVLSGEAQLANERLEGGVQVWGCTLNAHTVAIVRGFENGRATGIGVYYDTTRWTRQAFRKQFFGALWSSAVEGKTGAMEGFELLEPPHCVERVGLALGRVFEDPQGESSMSIIGIPNVDTLKYLKRLRENAPRSAEVRTDVKVKQSDFTLIAKQLLADPDGLGWSKQCEEQNLERIEVLQHRHRSQCTLLLHFFPERQCVCAALYLPPKDVKYSEAAVLADALALLEQRHLREGKWLTQSNDSPFQRLGKSRAVSQLLKNLHHLFELGEGSTNTLLADAVSAKDLALDALARVNRLPERHLSFAWPDAIFALSKRERHYSKLSDGMYKLGDDFFLRARLRLPVQDDEPYVIDTWAQLRGSAVVHQVRGNGHDAAEAPPLEQRFGVLANALPLHTASTVGVEVEILGGEARKPPILLVKEGPHALYAEQKEGISVKRAQHYTDFGKPRLNS